MLCGWLANRIFFKNRKTDWGLDVSIVLEEANK